MHIIFITAYDQYAIDYLLKPVQEEHLQKSLQRVQEKMQAAFRDTNSINVNAIDVKSIAPR